MTEQDLIWGSPADEMSSGRSRRGWLERVLGVADRGGSLSAAVLVAALGAASFVASMAYEWQLATIDLSPPTNGGDATPQVYTFHLAPSSVDGLGTVYVVAMIALLTTAGVAISWRQLAQRLRVVSTGVGVGVIGVLIALTIRLPTAITQQGVVSLPSEYFSKITSSHKAGLYFGFLAVVLTLAAIWLAGPSIRRTDSTTVARQGEVREAATVKGGSPSREPPSPTAVPVQSAHSTQDAAVAPFGYEQGTVSGLSVSAADPVDRALHPGDSWHR